MAVVLAFLIRTFEAEAFVIPTGSMAPALMGAHKDLECPECASPFQVSASDIQEENGESKPARVNAGICPMCRAPDIFSEKSNPSYAGDRVLVDKFCYQLKPLERWDVVVFHFPGDASKNYIKRLTGLPGETLWIKHGALWTQPNDRPNEPFRIARKPPEKLLAMLEPVFDNDYMPAIARWAARRAGAATAGGHRTSGSSRPTARCPAAPGCAMSTSCLCTTRPPRGCGPNCGRP